MAALGYHIEEIEKNEFSLSLKDPDSHNNALVLDSGSFLYSQTEEECNLGSLGIFVPCVILAVIYHQHDYE